MTKLYEVELNSKGMPNFSTAKEVPQRIKGEWIQDNYYDEKYVCDKCGEPCATYINGKPRDRFCKWCGADMRGEDDEKCMDV